MNLYRICICAVLVMTSTLSYSQGNRCLSYEYNQMILQQNPDFLENRKSRNQQIAKIIKSRDNRKNGVVVTLPIVFHIIYNTSAQNLDSTQIASQIDVVNDDFRKINSNFNIIQGGFSSLAADVEFEFRLADLDPDGNPTNGITRTITTNPAIGGSDVQYYDPNRGGVAAWDPERFINVWVVNINSAGGDFGFASFPGEADPKSSEGIVIDYKYLGTTGTAAASQPQHLGRTLTHELGHYFGLEHIWGDVDDCSNDDGIADTPMQETSTETCPTFPLRDNCTSSGDGINFYNYMDYTDDACMAMFTAGQAARMQAILAMPYSQGGRSELLELYSSNRSIPTRSLSVSPNPFSSRLNIQLDDAVQIGNEINVYDITGQIVHTSIVRSSNMEIDLSDRSNGIYFVKINTNEAIWYSKVILIKE